MTERRGADSPPDDLALQYRVLGLEPGASPGEVSRAYAALLKERNPEGLPEGSELRREAEERLQSCRVAFQRIRATWPEDVQQIVEAFERDDNSSTEPGLLLPTGRRVRLPTLFDFTDKAPWVRQAVGVWTVLCGIALIFPGAAFLGNPGWFSLLAVSPVALLVAGAWYVGVKFFMRSGRG